MAINREYAQVYDRNLHHILDRLALAASPPEPSLAAQANLTIAIAAVREARENFIADAFPIHVGTRIWYSPELVIEGESGFQDVKSIVHEAGIVIYKSGVSDRLSELRASLLDGNAEILAPNSGIEPAKPANPEI